LRIFSPFLEVRSSFLENPQVILPVSILFIKHAKKQINPILQQERLQQAFSIVN